MYLADTTTFSLSPNGIQLLKELEGLRLLPYVDGLHFAIGYGHQIQQGEEWMLLGITKQQAEQILQADVAYFGNIVNKYYFDSDGNSIGYWITQQMFDALVSFAYNIGADNFNNSQLAQMVQQGPPYDDVYDWWLNSWVGSPPKPGLQARRKKEADYAFMSAPQARGTNWLPWAAGIGALLLISNSKS